MSYNQKSLTITNKGNKITTKQYKNKTILNPISVKIEPLVPQCHFFFTFKQIAWFFGIKSPTLISLVGLYIDAYITNFNVIETYSFP